MSAGLIEAFKTERGEGEAVPHKRRSLFVGVVLRAGLLGALLALVAWSAAALWIDGPASRIWAGLLTGGFLITCSSLLLVVAGIWTRVLAVLGLVGLVMMWWLSIAARNDRNWQPSVARLATATIQDHFVTI